jgi:hypothetical protein
MKLEGLSRTDPARRFECSRASVTKKLNLPNLSSNLLLEIESMGDYRVRRLVTEKRLGNHTSVESVTGVDSSGVCYRGFFVN